MENDFIARLDEYMHYAGLNDNKVTVECGLSNGVIGKARKSRSVMSGENIVRILNIYRDLDARWLMTGEGEMISGVSDSDNPDITDFLKKQNSELMAKIDLLNQEIGELKNELKSMKKEHARQGMAADDAAADSYRLAK